MSVLKALTRGAEDKLWVNDVFSAYTYTGNGSTQTITNGIDLAGKGGMVWTTIRSTAGYGHHVVTTASGVNKHLKTENNTAQVATTTVTSFNSDGYAISAAGGYINNSTFGEVGWTFRNAPNFYHHEVVVKSAGSNATFNFSMHSAGLGMVRVKRTDSTGSWYVWHRSLTAGKLLIGETTAAEATLGHITVSGTTVTLVNGVIADGTYLVEAWAHDTSAEGIIQCGSFTSDGSGNATVSLGWETQFVISKTLASIDNWITEDVSRNMCVTKGTWLYPNLANAEAASSPRLVPSATGFYSPVGLSTNTSYIYLAIRRPNKPPTVGTQVYKAIAWTGNSTARSITGAGFPPDAAFIRDKSATTGYSFTVQDRLRGATNELWTWATDAETTGLTNCLTSFDMDGVSLGTDAANHGYNKTANPEIGEFFRRAHGFFDIICDTGTGSAHTIAHNLTVAPELMIRKKRGAADAWYVYHANNTANPETDYLVLNTTAATADLDTIWNDTAPTASVFTVGTHDDVNQNTGTFVTLLFATLAGISKCGTYTGNGTTQNIEMGFTTGARFFLVKATSATGNWVVFDSVRGIIAGSDPYLLLNSTAAEDTDEDAVDPYNGGVTVNETTASNINTNGVVYCYLAIA